MFTGTHILFYSADPAADRAFLRDVLAFPFVDTGDGWLIFKTPSAEAGVHPLAGPNIPAEAVGQASSLPEDTGKMPAPPMLPAQIYLMCADINAAIQQLAARKVSCPAPENQGWGILTTIVMPSGGCIGLYQPLHATAFEL